VGPFSFSPRPASSDRMNRGCGLKDNYRPRLQEPLPVGERLATEWPVKGLLNWLLAGVESGSSGAHLLWMHLLPAWISYDRDTVVDDTAIRMPNPV
jgi:hypothetical protein